MSESLPLNVSSNIPIDDEIELVVDLDDIIRAEKIERIARVTHEANRAYCQGIGDNSQLPWDQAPQWQKDSAIKGVIFNLENPTAPASASHDSWLAEKAATGWKYGPVKDPEKKEHPCFVPYAELPVEQRLKDHLFKAVVAALSQDA